MAPDPWSFGWDALVAIGTLALAVATLILAGVTTKVARKTGKLAEATEREIDVAMQNVAVASAGVAGQVRPVLIGVPAGRSGGATETVVVPGLATAVQFDDPATIFFDYHAATLFISVPFRNEGVGVAFIERGSLHPAGASDSICDGTLSTRAVPPDEILRVSFGIEPGEPIVDPADDQFAVVARYSDLAGAVWASRLELSRTGATWAVSDVLVTSEGQTTNVGGPLISDA